MISLDWPETYVSRPRSPPATLPAAVACGDAVAAVVSSITRPSPMISRARGTWPCQRRQRICSMVSAWRAASLRSPGVASGSTLGGLSDMLNTHGEMKPIEHMVGWTNARRLTRGSWPVGAVAQDGDRRTLPGTLFDDRIAEAVAAF